LFTPAFAQSFGGAGGGMDIISTVLPFAAILAIMYVLVLRPQQKKAKEVRDMVSNVRRGDTVVTTGGLIGKVSKATEGPELELEIAQLEGGQKVRIRVLRANVAEVRAKGEPVKETAVKA
jgi:preprotein translocase subunit YajC